MKSHISRRQLPIVGREAFSVSPLTKKRAVCDQFRAKRHEIWIIHRENFDGCSPLGGLSDQEGFLPRKMGNPIVAARMKQAGQLSRERINAGNVRPLAAITSDATEREIFRIALTTVLAGDDMVDLESGTVASCNIRSADRRGGELPDRGTFPFTPPE
ncbi:MAG TPA: hypothetical protein VG326_05665 [Tepidisphaeraceae bacterium]|jgi:hypothetical protein|nr:hypothetical protein [Tepidisphaeraceae bacterium]